MKRSIDRKWLRCIGGMSMAVFFVLCGAAREAAGGASAMATKLDTIAAATQARLNAIDAGMAAAAKELGRIWPDASRAGEIIDGACRPHDPVVDCLTFDRKGIITSVFPHTYDWAIGKDISTKLPVQALLSTGKPLMSDLVKRMEGFYAVYIVSPVLGQGGKLQGAISAVLRPEKLLSEIVAPLATGVVRNVWVLQQNGQFLYSMHAEKVGENPFDQPDEETPRGLLPLLIQVAKTPSGSGSFFRPPAGHGDPEEVPCLWKTVALRGTEWRILVFGPEEE